MPRVLPAIDDNALPLRKNVCLYMTRPTRSEGVFETLKQVRCALLALLL
jgi:hypothetical protein